VTPIQITTTIPAGCMTVKETCEYLKISRSELDKLRLRGEIRFWKRGTKVLFRTEWVVEYLDRESGARQDAETPTWAQGVRL
jgi:excisionase family DNA binding protein